MASSFFRKLGFCFHLLLAAICLVAGVAFFCLFFFSIWYGDFVAPMAALLWPIYFFCGGVVMISCSIYKVYKPGSFGGAN